jgi:hypothetical protein
MHDRFGAIVARIVPAAVCVLAAMLAAVAARADDPADAGRTLQLVTDAACESQAPTLLSQWEADRRADGWKVLKRIVSTADPAALKAELGRRRPDHTFLVGDGVPFLKATADPDGHGARPLVADYKFVQGAEAAPFGAIGRLWFKTQASARIDSMGLYRRYFAKRHTWSEDRARLGPMVRFSDHLSFRPDGAQWAKAVMRQAPEGRIERPELKPAASDGEAALLAHSPRLIEIAFSGGQPFSNPGGLYYFGGAAAWREADPSNVDAGPKVGIFGAYGSFLCELEWNNSFLMSTLTTRHTVAAFYDFQGIFPYGRLFEGHTIGDCGRIAAQRGFYLTNVYGDPTVTIPQ